MSRQFWSPRDDKLLHSIYPWLPTPEVAEASGRSVCAIYGRVDLLGVELEAYELLGEGEPDNFFPEADEKVSKAQRLSRMLRTGMQ